MKTMVANFRGPRVPQGRNLRRVPTVPKGRNLRQVLLGITQLNHQKIHGYGLGWVCL